MPAWPVNIFPYIFAGYLLIGIAWFMMLRRRDGFIEQVRHTVYVDHAPTAAGEVMPLKRQRASVPAA